MSTIKDLHTLSTLNPKRFSSVTALIASGEPEAYRLIVESVSRYSNASGYEKGVIGKETAPIRKDLFVAVADFVKAEVDI